MYVTITLVIYIANFLFVKQNVTPIAIVIWMVIPVFRALKQNTYTQKGQKFKKQETLFQKHHAVRTTPRKTKCKPVLTLPKAPRTPVVPKTPTALPRTPPKP